MADKEDINRIVWIRTQNQRKIGEIYEFFKPGFFAYIRSAYSKQPDYIFDLYQDSFITLCSNISKGKLSEDTLTCSLKTYLFGIGKFTLMSRDRKYKEILDDMELKKYHLNAYEDIDNLQDELMRDEIIQKTVNEMGEPCSSLFDLFYWEGKSGAEIVEVTNGKYSSPDSVKTQKYKCMQRLKVVLSDKLSKLNL